LEYITVPDLKDNTEREDSGNSSTTLGLGLGLGSFAVVYIVSLLVIVIVAKSKLPTKKNSETYIPMQPTLPPKKAVGKDQDKLEGTARIKAPVSGGVTLGSDSGGEEDTFLCEGVTEVDLQQGRATQPVLNHPAAQHQPETQPIQIADGLVEQANPDQTEAEPGNAEAADSEETLQRELHHPEDEDPRGKSGLAAGTEEAGLGERQPRPGTTGPSETGAHDMEQTKTKATENEETYTTVAGSQVMHSSEAVTDSVITTPVDEDQRSVEGVQVINGKCVPLKAMTGNSSFITPPAVAHEVESGPSSHVDWCDREKSIIGLQRNQSQRKGRLSRTHDTSDNDDCKDAAKKSTVLFKEH
jgi:hypothetical protein